MFDFPLPLSFLNYSVPCGVQDRSGSSRFDSNRIVGGMNSSPGKNIHRTYTLYSKNMKFNLKVDTSMY